MADTGFNYIREIMQMNLPEESTLEALKEYEREEKAKKFHYIGLTPYKPFDHNCKVLIMPPGMAGVIAVNKDELRPIHASVNDVVQHCGRLFVYTNTGIWSQFVPGPCTNYDGPNPYKKKVYTSTSTVYDSTLAEAIRDNLKKSLDKAGILGPCELERVSDTEIVAKYDVKYIGETFTDVRKYHDNQVVWLHHPIRVYNQVRHEANIGEAVKWDDLIYVWNGSQWVEFPKPEKVALEWPKTNKEEKKNMAPRIRYIGKSTSVVEDGSTTKTVRIRGEWVNAEPGDIVMYDYDLYVFGDHDPMKLTYWKKISDGMFSPPGIQYDKIPANWLTIKKVHFNNPLTVVLWQDGTKTIVKCSDNEVFDPEKGLAMAITKKVFGNKYAYHEQIKKLLPEPEEDDGLTIKERLNKIFGDPRIADAKKKLAAVQDLICDMTFNGATKAELVRAIKYSKDLIDFTKGVDTDINASAERYRIIELEAKYQPKK